MTLSQKFYWKSLYHDESSFCQTCDICQRTKRDFGKRPAPLHPLKIPEGPGYVWQLDHTILSRKN
jgi:hypothetical protein